MGKIAYKYRLDQIRPLFDVRFDELFGSISDHFSLKHEVQFDELYDYLFGLSCRDQEGEPDDPSPQPKELARRRSEGYKLASSMRDNARAMLTSLGEIHRCYLAFNDDVVRWNPSLLEAVFDVDTGDPDNLFLPEQLDVLQSFFGFNWDAVDDRLTAMAALPVRRDLATGPVANVTLRRVVKACRFYWRDIEKRSWSMSALNRTETRNNKDAGKPAERNLLQNECEIFVALMLEYSGIRYSLQELSTAWRKMDERS